MILEIFITLLIITFALILFGSYFEIPAVTITGISFLFILGVIMINQSGLGGIEYQTGSFINETSPTTYQVTKTFSTFNDVTFGIFISIIAMLWFIITIINIRRAKDED